MITIESIQKMGLNALYITEEKVCRSDSTNKKPYFEAIEARRVELSEEVSVMAVSSKVKID